MDSYQMQEREITIRRAIKSAISYLEKHPKRSVSLMLSNAVTVSKIVLLDCSGSTTYTATVDRGAEFVLRPTAESRTTEEGIV